LKNIKNKTLKLALLIILCIVIIFIAFIIYLFVESEKMFYKYANEGDTWFCEKYNISLTCHVKENDSPIPDYYLNATIDGIDKEFIIKNLMGGHAKEWVWSYSETAEQVETENSSDIPVLYGEYYVKNNDTFEFTVYPDDEPTMEIEDECLYSKLKPKEVLTFEKVDN